MSDALPTISSIIAELQVVGTQVNGTDQILAAINELCDGVNAAVFRHRVVANAGLWGRD